MNMKRWNLRFLTAALKALRERDREGDDARLARASRGLPPSLFGYRDHDAEPTLMPWASVEQETE
jgi:hypothetical protein